MTRKSIQISKKTYRRLKLSIFVLLSLLLFSIGSAYASYEQKMLTTQKYQEKVKEINHQLNELTDTVQKMNQENELLKQQLESKLEKERIVQETIDEGRRFNVIVTAYDLSVESCGKSPSHPSYGRTATGSNLAGHSLESARTIAVDPNVIPLGSQVKLEFHDEYMQQYNGVYEAADTGGAINGNVIDLFVGENASDLAMKIGRRYATLTIL